MTPKTKLIATSGAATLLIAAVIVFFIQPDTDPGAQFDSSKVALMPYDAEFVVRGRRLYDEHCGSCHGESLQGQPDWRSRLPSGRLPAPPHDETGHTWHHPDKMLFELTKFGPTALVGGSYQSDMPGYKGVLSDEEIVAVLSYIKSRWPSQIRKRHDQMNARSR